MTIVLLENVPLLGMDWIAKMMFVSVVDPAFAMIQVASLVLYFLQEYSGLAMTRSLARRHTSEHRARQCTSNLSGTLIKLDNRPGFVGKGSRESGNSLRDIWYKQKGGKQYA